MEFVRPWLVDEIDDRAVGFISCGREDADGFVEEDVTCGAGLEDIAVGGEVIEFSEREISVGDGLVVEKDLSGIDEFFGMAFPESAMFGDELGNIHVSGFFLQGGKRNGRRGGSVKFRNVGVLVLEKWIIDHSALFMEG